MAAGWVLGAAIQLCGCVVINLGVNLMKLGHDIRAEACARGQGRPIYKHWQWVVGCLAFALGNVANFASYAFASQALLTALSSAQFVSQVLFSWWLLGERVRLRVLLATALIIAGNVVLVCGASKSDPRYSSRELRQLYLSTQFSIYLTAAVGLGVPFTYGLAELGLKRTARQRPGATANTLWLKLTPVAYSVCSSLVGAQAVLFSTSLSILGRETLAGNNQLAHWFTAVLVLGLAATAVFWVTRLNQGLRHFEASVIIPMLQIVWMLLIMVSGNLYFQEFNRFSRLQLATFVCGVALLLLGIYCLTPSEEPSGQQLEGAAAGGGKTVGLEERELRSVGHWHLEGEEDVVAAVTLLGRNPGAKLSNAEPACSPDSERQQRLAALGELDVEALLRLPQKHLLGVLRQLQLLPRSEGEAVQIEQALQRLAWRQRQQEAEEQQQQRRPADLEWEQQQQVSQQPPSLPAAHLPAALRPELSAVQQGAGECQGAWPGEARLSLVSNPLFEEEEGEQPTAAAAGLPQQIRGWAPTHLAGAGTPALPSSTSSPPRMHNNAGSPGSPVLALRHSSRRSSIAALTAAAASSLRQSVVATVGLMAGMGENEHLQAASVYSLPMLTPAKRRNTPSTLSTLLVAQRRGVVQQHHGAPAGHLAP